MVIQMHYGEILKLYRERNGYTHIKMGEILTISDSLYNRYEQEKQIIPIKHLNTLCNFYNISLDYAFGFTKKESYNNSSNEINKNLMKIRLKELRNTNNLTQAGLAKVIHSSNSAISEYERKANIIATPFLYDICKKYNISADYLLGKTDTPKYYK